ncbi:septum formation initiator family protein [Agreia pratensis]|uniref:FtsB family cell division protein n=1 Tax=Agreia pratensis TaxID=150121 RepID=UPI00188B5675|nr:septum formation initiator family protein [Agreia pratensis]MBF4634684.1 septum formation initiator family protein [Agreia pratensis]
MRKPTLGAPLGAASSDDAPKPRNARAPRGTRIPRSRGTSSQKYSFRVSGLTFVILGVLVVFVIVLAPGLRLYIEQRQQLAALQQAVADKQTENTQLDSQVARWSDPAYIKAQARERLYFVMPGETSFLVIDDQPPTAPTDDAPVTTGIQNTKVDWLGAIFSSGVNAGLSTQTPEELQKSGSIQ